MTADGNSFEKLSRSERAKTEEKHGADPSRTSEKPTELDGDKGEKPMQDDGGSTPAEGDGREKRMPSE
jgi:hypothetical protein